MPDPLRLVETGAFLLVLASFLSVFARRATEKYLYLLSFSGAICFGWAGVVFMSGAELQLASFAISPYLPLSFSSNPLAGFFLLIISCLAASVSIYSIGYSEAVENRVLMGFLYNLFLLSMYAVILSGNIVTFLISWETMSIISYFLVTLDRTEKSEKAGLIYAAMTHIGTAFIIALFLILYKFTGQEDFASIKASGAGLSPWIKSVVFILAAIGFGSKAGIVPLHAWLPKAHPAAPSNISALMSGVMIKTGIYGFLRITMDVMGSGPQWWGIAIIAVGAVSSILGVLYALTEHDLKRLLAYHSVENIGIILLGIGASLSFRSHGLNTLSALALLAGLYHTLNHAIFKGLLFLGAGSILHSTHTKNMEEMGGLIKAMPYTGLFFLVGSVSICALPPFNGFVSEWLTFQSLLLGFNTPSLTVKIISPLGGAALALTGALAAACFVKAFSIPFLGMPRSQHASKARESSFTMLSAMAALSLLCLALGIFPSAVTDFLSPVVASLTGSGPALAGAGIMTVEASSVSPSAMAVTIAAAAVFALVVVPGVRKIRYGDSWDCGIPSLTPRMQYSATGFAKPLITIFRRIYLPSKEIDVSYIIKPFFVKSARYKSDITPFFERYIYEPLTSFTLRFARKARLLQSGSLHLYLGYMLITLVLLLIFWI